MKNKKNLYNENGERICKKCKNPIPFDNRNDLCDNCAREKAKGVKGLLGSLGAAVVTVVSVIIFRRPRR